MLEPRISVKTGVLKKQTKNCYTTMLSAKFFFFKGLTAYDTRDVGLIAVVTEQVIVLSKPLFYS